MDKKRLNDEIILCRRAVRRARVIVIRKILKKMKILKSCKNEALKEKKLKKSERLLEKIQILKKLQEDDITKFALKNKDLEKFIKETPSNLKENAMACLAKHEAVVKKVENIREQIPNWETELPLLLDSFEKKNHGKKSKVENCDEQSVKSVEKIISEVQKTSEQVPRLAKTKGNSNEKESDDKAIEKEEKSQIEKLENGKIEKLENSKIEKLENSKIEKLENGKIEKLEKSKIEKQVNRSFEESKSIEMSEASVEEELLPPIKEEKIDDPFFIEKKVIAPKLLPDPPPKENVERKRFHPEGGSFIFRSKPFKVKKESRFNNSVKKSVVEDEKLHPSWAAKKVQLIKPFEGKKIKFSD